MISEVKETARLGELKLEPYIHEAKDSRFYGSKYKILLIKVPPGCACVRGVAGSVIVII